MRVRGEGGGRNNGPKRICQVSHRCCGVPSQRWETKGGKPEEGGLPVKLQVILSLQDVVENPETASNACFAAPLRIPGKADARRPVILVRKIGADRSLGVAREEQPERGVF